MKQVSKIERQVKILKKAVKLGFRFEVDQNFTSIIYDAEDFLIEYAVHSDGYEQDKFQRNQNNLYWTDRMGFEFVEFGEFHPEYHLWMVDSKANVHLITL